MLAEVAFDVTTKFAALPAFVLTLPILIDGLIVAVPVVGAPKTAFVGAEIVIVKFKPAPAAKVVTGIVAVVAPAKIVPVPVVCV